MYVYKITNKINGKAYIGLTVKAAPSRWVDHWYEATHQCRFPLHRAMIKYGLENSTFEVVFVASSGAEMSAKEIELIKKLNLADRRYGYNLSEGGRLGFTRTHTVETKRKISEAKRGCSPSPRRKLNDDAVKFIKSSTLSYNELAQKFGAHKRSIQYIKDGETYQNVGDV